jgi:membrane protease YdiL (CAAX protease family)
MFSTLRNLASGYVEAPLNALRKKPDLTNRQALLYLSIAAFLTFVVPLVQDLIVQHSDIEKPFLALPFFGLSSGVIFYFFTRERIRVSFISLLMFIFGIILAGISLMLLTWHGGMTYRGSFASISALVSIFNQSVVIPFYEELTVRTFLFMGVAKYLGFVLAAIVVSVLFGLIHVQTQVFAFFASILLCYFAYRNVGVFDRAILHGSYNFALIISVVMLGNG